MTRSEEYTAVNVRLAKEDDIRRYRAKAAEADRKGNYVLGTTYTTLAEQLEAELQASA